MKRKPKVINFPFSKTPYLDKLRKILKDEATLCTAACPNQAVIDGLADKVSKLEQHIKKLLLCSFLNIKGKLSARYSTKAKRWQRSATKL